MTNAELKKYYADLLIAQYIDKAKAHAHVEALSEQANCDQIPLEIQDAFNIDTAVGVQLDLLGLYAGVSRVVPTMSGTQVLSDSDFRFFIKLLIVKNTSSSTLYEIQALIKDYLSSALIVFDFKNMTMNYYFDAAFGSVVLAEAMVSLKLLPKPMAVSIGALIYINNIDQVFGYRNYDFDLVGITGFQSYGDYNLDQPWLSYTNAIMGA